MKKVLSILIIVSVLMSTLTFAEVKGFTDVKESDWFYVVVNEAVEKGLVNGYPDGSFKPQGNIKWGELVTIANKMFPEHFDEMPWFNDLSRYENETYYGHWATRVTLSSLVGSNIHSNYVTDDEKWDSTQEPTGPSQPAQDLNDKVNMYTFLERKVTRYDMVSYLSDCLGAANIPEYITKFEDTTSHVPSGMADLGIISGSIVNGKRYFNGDDFVTRAEAAKILLNTLKYKENPTQVPTRGTLKLDTSGVYDYYLNKEMAVPYLYTNDELYAVTGIDPLLKEFFRVDPSSKDKETLVTEATRRAQILLEDGVISKNMTETEIVRKLYDYYTETYVYGFGTTTGQNAMVCGDTAVFMTTMLRSLDIKAYTLSYFNMPTSYQHAITLVYADGKWFNLDASGAMSNPQHKEYFFNFDYKKSGPIVVYYQQVTPVKELLDAGYTMDDILKTEEKLNEMFKK